MVDRTVTPLGTTEAGGIGSPIRGDEPDERYSDVLAARQRVQASQPLGDESAMDLLALRDHVVGLEAELVNARGEAAHWQEIAEALRAELRGQLSRKALRAANLVTRTAAAGRARARGRAR